MSRKSRDTTRLLLPVLLVAVAMAGVVALSGCALLDGSTVSVSDANNLFHFKVPEKWLVTNEGDVLSVYADKRLPVEGEDPSALSLIVLSSTEASSAPVADVLTYLIDARAEQRGWTDVQKGEIGPVTVGGREGVSVQVSATSSEAKAFDSRYYFVRSGGNEVFVAAVAPPGKSIDAYDKDLKRITEQWFWHFDAAAEASEGASDTAQ